MNIGAGTSIGHYELVKMLGTGSAGEVYRAQDKSLGRTVAIKLLTEQTAALDTELRRRFVQEAKAASALNHPNILTVFEAGQYQGLDYMVMEYVEGQTLREYLKAGKVSLPTLLNIAIQMCVALESAHAADIIHRDIKPDNIMIRKDGLVKLLDFGLAKIKDKQNQALTSTKPGTLLGTIGYMSPEQAQCEPNTDARADIFSLGAVIYEMATSFPPFYQENHIDTLYAILKSDPKPFTEEQGVPTDLQELILKALAKDPNDRYQSAKEMLVELRNLSKAEEFQRVLQHVEENSGSPEAKKLGLGGSQSLFSSQVYDGDVFNKSNQQNKLQNNYLPWILVVILSVIVIIETLIILFR
ncbi:MAG: serine/threonine protein kinase [Acidobacteria bacterium]|nr:serine/threonine protein kinase [Acidobacteriota bacterium]